MSFRGIMFVSAMCVFVVSCSRNEKTVGTKENPLVIGFSYPYYENLTDKDFTKLKRRIEDDLGIFVDFSTHKDSVDLLEKIGGRRIDVSFLTLNEYLIAREYYRVEPKLRVLRKKGVNSYYGVIATLSSDIINNIEKLDGKKIATRSPYSVSGFILPSIVFSRLRIKPVYIFTESFDFAVEKLRKREVDAVSVYKSYTEKNKDLKILYEFGPIPNEPVVCRSRLDKLLCGRVVNEFVKLCSEKEFKDIFSKMADITGFEESNISDYKELHQIIKEYSHIIYTFIPQGIKIKKVSEEYKID
ncbi:MAG: phosphate/phosphite/phosphonate ABC transporter substrate-binding protein [Elusimicrobiales bacterium]